MLDPIVDFIASMQKDGIVRTVPMDSYKAVEIREDNFHTLERMEPKKRIFAVDGGSSIIIDGASWIIAKLKIAVVGYAGKKRVFESVQDVHFGGILQEGKLVAMMHPVDRELLNAKIVVNEVDDIPNIFRALMEWKAAIKLMDQLEAGDILLMDSSFMVALPDQITQYELMRRAFTKAFEKGIIIVGIPKTSRLKTNIGRSLLGYLYELSQKKFAGKMWYYYPIFKGEMYAKKDLGTNYVVKFHENAKYCYRVEFEKQMHSYMDEEWVKDVLGSIAYYCNDPELLGYPYPLLRVDKLARIGEHEKKSEVRKVKFIAKSKGLDFVEYDEKATNMHSELDSRMYRD